MPTPAARHYRMPAEWEPHEATWISWPQPNGISFPGAYERVLPAFVAMIEALACSEIVRICVADAEQERNVRGLLGHVPPERVEFFQIPTNEPWCRDHGPIFLTRDEPPRLAVVDFGYNAWGWKYPPCDFDDEVPKRVADALGVHRFDYNTFVLEGGAIDTNGQGALLTTRSCLLNPNRNPSMTQEAIEKKLKDTLGVRQILWLAGGLQGDDTDGHVDTVARFVSEDTVLAAVEENAEDPNYDALKQNLEILHAMSLNDCRPLNVDVLPMPSPIYREGQRLPATYANFYIANTVVLLPVFHDNNDEWAASVLRSHFPGREVVPIDCTELIWGLGACHCLTQQQPAVAP